MTTAQRCELHIRIPVFLSEEEGWVNLDLTMADEDVRKLADASEESLEALGPAMMLLQRALKDRLKLEDEGNE